MAEPNKVSHDLIVKKLETFTHQGEDMFRLVASECAEVQSVDMIISNLNLYRLSLGDTLHVTVEVLNAEASND